jgi:hypothetical protein
VFKIINLARLLGKKLHLNTEMPDKEAKLFIVNAITLQKIKE